VFSGGDVAPCCSQTRSNIGWGTFLVGGVLLVGTLRAASGVGRGENAHHSAAYCGQTRSNIGWGAFFVGGQEALIALRDVNSLISLFNQRKASNIWPIPAPGLPSALSFFSAASAVQPRCVIASAKGGKLQLIVVSKCVPTSGGVRFLLGALSFCSNRVFLWQEL